MEGNRKPKKSIGNYWKILRTFGFIIIVTQRKFEISINKWATPPPSKEIDWNLRTLIPQTLEQDWNLDFNLDITDLKHLYLKPKT